MTDDIRKLVGEISLKYQSRDSGGETEVDLFAVVGAFYELEKEKDKQLAEAAEILKEHEWCALGYTECMSCGAKQYPWDDTKSIWDDDSESEVHEPDCKLNKWLQEQRKAENIN